MLLPSQFMLNNVTEKEKYTIYPYCLQKNNVFSLDDIMKPIKIPDINPASLKEDSDFSMTAGDFLEVYGNQKNEWNCVITCFFIDTAKNIFEYIETIKECLDDGGIWINDGPLLFHWTDTDEVSIELSYEEIKDVIEQFGFEILEEKRHSTTYAANKNSMMNTNYNCIFFVAKLYKNKN
jgi:carnosine N-methyltransferase